MTISTQDIKNFLLDNKTGLSPQNDELCRVDTIVKRAELPVLSDLLKDDNISPDTRSLDEWRKIYNKAHKSLWRKINKAFPERDANNEVLHNLSDMAFASEAIFTTLGMKAGAKLVYQLLGDSK